LQVSLATYCGKDAYLTHQFSGLLEGFVVTKVVSNLLNDVEGFVGYLPSDKSIYVGYKGSTSIENWVTDFDATKSDLDYVPDCNCQVHAGVKMSVDAVYDDVLSEVQRLRGLEETKDFSIKTTGHSFGAALAQITGVYLSSDSFDVSMINFGQLRVGDAEYAEWSNVHMPKQFRVTHHKDPIPHLPFENMGYKHSRWEMYEDKDHVVRQCDDSGEDRSCADRWHSFQWDGNDHTLYLNQCLMEHCDQCGFSAQFLQ